jgi:hypothetical protein
MKDVLAPGGASSDFAAYDRTGVVLRHDLGDDSHPAQEANRRRRGGVQHQHQGGGDMMYESPRDPAPRVSIPGDRRQPAARYVEFGDEDIQAQFIGAAEDAYRRLVHSDRFAVLGQVELPSARRGLFRRPPGRVVATTAALASVARTASEIPGEVKSSPNGCTSSHRVAQLLATVATDLVHDLLVRSPAEQAAHPAYRQTLRLAAELEGVRDIVTHVSCTSPEACVALRPPEHWGRRAEDVEVAEVRAVLLRHARA